MDAQRVFLTTGAASGIGKHLTTVLAARGHKVFATDVNESGLAVFHSKSHEPGKIVTKALNVTSAVGWEEAMDEAEKAFGPVDVVMNIAGFLKPGFIHEVDDKSIDLHIDVNVKGVILGTRAAARRMVARGSGHIINFGSLASLSPTPGLSLYAASKFAVRGLSLSAGAELAGLGVAVTVVMPDAVKTPMLDLQVHYREAALTFSGEAPLTVEDIEKVIIDRVLPKKPLEVALPLSRALLARAANAAPEAALALAPTLMKKGLAAQEKIRRGGSSGG
ncbi:MAG: SDR family oxidoreductase [Polyangiaceae bacterium]|nr:SDR family oxidoreductase [Polyangiaceae bacterium]